MFKITETSQDERTLTLRLDGNVKMLEKIKDDRVRIINCSPFINHASMT